MKERTCKSLAATTEATAGYAGSLRASLDQLFLSWKQDDPQIWTNTSDHFAILKELCDLGDLERKYGSSRRTNLEARSTGNWFVWRTDVQLQCKQITVHSRATEKTSGLSIQEWHTFLAWRVSNSGHPRGDWIWKIDSNPSVSHGKLVDTMFFVRDG